MVIVTLIRSHLPEEENPACLQTTCASIELQWSSHTVPHMPLTQTSTRPSRDDEPPISLIAPLVQAEETIQYHDTYFLISTAINFYTWTCNNVNHHI